MALVTDVRLQEAFSLALEDRSKKLADLVSTSNVLLAIMKENGGWKRFSGPAIRESLIFDETGSYKRYQGYEFLNPVPKELVNDAVFEPKMAAVSVTLSGQDLLLNSGPNQIADIMETHIDAAERELRDNFYIDLHSDGTADGGKQVTGFQAALPATPAVGVYGGIDRATHAQWRTQQINTSTITGAGTMDASNAHDILTYCMIQTSRGKDGPNVIAMDQKMYRIYLSSLVGIQQVVNEKRKATLGFPAVAFAGAGRNVDVVLEGGIGSAMPADTTYFMKVGGDGYKFRYHPERNFTSFGGRRTPVNQDAIVQHLGFMGNLTLQNPLWQLRLDDA